MKIISLSGKKSSGKTTAANLLKNILLRLNPQAKVEIISWADALKEEVTKACGVSLEQIETNKPQFRPILQWWGAEFRRSKLGGGEDYWIVRWLQKVKKLDNNSIVIVPDTRFINELEVVKYVGGLVWRVVRPSTDSLIDQHASETGLDNYNKWDAKINNTGSLWDLESWIMIEVEKAKLHKG